MGFGLIYPIIRRTSVLVLLREIEYFLCYDVEPRTRMILQYKNLRYMNGRGRLRYKQVDFKVNCTRTVIVKLLDLIFSTITIC